MLIPKVRSDLHFFTYLMLGPFFAAGEGLLLFTYRPLRPRTLPAPASCSRSTDGMMPSMVPLSLKVSAVLDTLPVLGVSECSGAVAVSEQIEECYGRKQKEKKQATYLQKPTNQIQQLVNYLQTCRDAEITNLDAEPCALVLVGCIGRRLAVATSAPQFHVGRGL